ARRICDRRFGVGADQLLWVRTPKNALEADARMEILNADGSIAEMCGNGIRAVALYLRERRPKLAVSESLRIETLAGTLEVRARGGLFRVNMGLPGLGSQDEALEVAGRRFRFFEVSMGNPHAVIFGESFEELPQWGPRIETH